MTDLSVPAEKPRRHGVKSRSEETRIRVRVCYTAEKVRLTGFPTFFGDRSRGPGSRSIETRNTERETPPQVGGERKVCFVECCGARAKSRV